MKVAPTKVREGEKAAETERTPAKDDPAFDKMRPGGSNSQYNADGTKKTKPSTGTGKPVENYKMGRPIPKDLKKKGTKGGDSQRPQTGKPKPKKEPKYNPYGTGTANPTNMSVSTGP